MQVSDNHTVRAWLNRAYISSYSFDTNAFQSCLATTATILK